MQEITIVTAFFDIGRENWQGFKRDNNKYVEYFKFWARMRNKIVIYTDKDTAQQVVQIRDSFGLADRTKVVVIDDIIALDSEVYLCMEKVLSNEQTIKFRNKPSNPESYNALYNYVVYLKPYFVADAVNRGLVSGMIAWVDFGYNHGGSFYLNPLDFDFLWQYDFSSKIHVFAVDPLDDTPVFEIVRSMKTYIAGGVIIAQDELWKVLAALFRESLFNLASCGMVDDDQTLLIMAYRVRSEIFEIHPIEDFFCPFKDFGGSHLTSVRLRKSKKTRKIAKRFLLDREYLQAIKYYLKYVMQKIQSV